MTSPTLTKIAAACAVLMLLASCANTIRGMGRDTAGAVNATEDAGHKVKRAVVN
ncbi:MAG TPA: entericidin [Rhizobium sp.]